MSGRILRACSKCAAPFEPRHGRHYHCSNCERTGNEHRSPTTRTRPSSSTVRERIRAEVLHRDPLCTIRLDGCTGASEVADHIVPAALGGRYEPDNLRGACDHCNSVRGGSTTSALKHGLGTTDASGPRISRGVARPAPVGTRLR